jgi:hypothetical protein
MGAMLKGLAAVLVRAWGSAAGWALTGCGWGVVAGAALEAAFGPGHSPLMETAGRISLEAAAGAVLGMTVVPLVGSCLLAAFGAIVAAVTGRLCGRYPDGNPARVLRERTARAGALVGLLVGIVLWPWFGAFGGAVRLLELLHDGGSSWSFVGWGTVCGCLAGGILGNIELVRTLYRAVPASWREELWLALPAPPAAPLRGPFG